MRTWNNSKLRLMIFVRPWWSIAYEDVGTLMRMKGGQTGFCKKDISVKRLVIGMACDLHMPLENESLAMWHCNQW